MYGSEPDTAQRFYPSGALEGSLRTDYRAPLPAWLTPEEEAVYDKLYPANSYRGPTNWYKMRVGKGLGCQDEVDTLPDHRIHVPTLYVEHAPSSASLQEMWERTAK